MNVRCHLRKYHGVLSSLLDSMIFEERVKYHDHLHQEHPFGSGPLLHKHDVNGNPTEYAEVKIYHVEFDLHVKQLTGEAPLPMTEVVEDVDKLVEQGLRRSFDYFDQELGKRVYNIEITPKT